MINEMYVRISFAYKRNEKIFSSRLEANDIAMVGLYTFIHF